MNKGLFLRGLLSGILAGIVYPLPLAAATHKVWEPVNASLSQLLYETRQMLFELFNAPSFQVLLAGVVLIGLLAWGWYFYGKGSEQVQRTRTGRRDAWRPRNVRRHGIHHFFDNWRQATA